MSTYKPNKIKSIFHQSRRKLAKFWNKLINPTVIAITGSQGKTTTSFLLSNLLPEAIITDTNLDTLYNVPITSLKLRPWKKLAIFELGIDHKNEMDLHLDIVKPRISIVTGISAVHADEEHLGSLENIIKEKRKIIEKLNEKDFAILNYDDENVRAMASYTKAKVLFYGSEKSKCDIYFDLNQIEILKEGTFGQIFDNGKKIKIQTKFLGKHQFYNISAIYLVYKIIKSNFVLSDFDEKFINIFQEKLQNINQLKGRMSLENGPKGSIILNDSLRANPASTIAGINIVGDIKIENSKKILVLGEMGELGDLSEINHRNIGKIIAKVKPDIYIGIGELQKFALDEAIKNGFEEKNAFNVKNPIEAGQIVKDIITSGDIIYLKGSLHRHLERFLMVLNNEEIKCSVTSCPLYNQCTKCKYRYSIYPN